MSARKVTPPTRNLMDDPAYSTCIANLRAAGDVILSPDEVRGIQSLADWARYEVGLDEDLTPGLAVTVRSLKGGRDAR